MDLSRPCIFVNLFNPLNSDKTFSACALFAARLTALHSFWIFLLRAENMDAFGGSFRESTVRMNVCERLSSLDLLFATVRRPWLPTTLELQGCRSFANQSDCVLFQGLSEGGSKSKSKSCWSFLPRPQKQFFRRLATVCYM